jgi:pimeloyl-ACP methyl ester carboxylesterase
MTTATINQQTVETRLGTIQVRRGGAGAPLVYLHSAAGEGEPLPLLEELARNNEVIAPMFPGFGESEGIEQIDGIEDAVFHLLDLWERLGLKAPAVMGLSLGGWMAAELATRYPEKLSALVLVNPAGLYIPGANIKDIFGRTPKEMAGDLFANQNHPIALLMHQMDRLITEGGIGSITFDMLKPQIQAMTATARLGWNPYLHNPKLRSRLWRITAPTLVVRAEHDTLIPEEHCAAYAEGIAGARLVTMGDTAHMVVLEEPAKLAEIVRDFLENAGS